MSDIIDACVEDSMEDMKDDSNAKLTHFVRTTDLEEDRYLLVDISTYILEKKFKLIQNLATKNSFLQNFLIPSHFIPSILMSKTK